MKNIKLPYYKDLMELNISENNLKNILVSKAHEFKVEFGEKKLIKKALENPLSSKKLRDIAVGKDKVVLITSDHTRPLPSKITIPILLDEIRKGNKSADITILIATGLHRATTEEEMIDKFGREIVEKENIIVHDANQKNTMKYICKLPSGADLAINKIATEADLLVTEGFIEPHSFAGFSGGRKSILPGISSKETINENHSAKAVGHINSNTGILNGNPIHEDMVNAAKKVGVDFIFNVALNDNKKIIAAFAGDINKAHLAGCEFVKKISGLPKSESEIVITTNGGYPLDQNFYQSGKGIGTASDFIKKGGVIIMVSSCCDGIGGNHFKQFMLGDTVEELLKVIKNIPPKKTIEEQWAAQLLLDILSNHKIILVTTYLDHELIKEMNLIPASNVNEALTMAYEIMGDDASVTVIPDGVSIMAIK